MKCVWKLLKKLPEWSDEIDYDRILFVINAFMKVIYFSTLIITGVQNLPSSHIFMCLPIRFPFSHRLTTRVPINFKNVYPFFFFSLNLDFWLSSLPNCLRHATFSWLLMSVDAGLAFSASVDGDSYCNRVQKAQTAKALKAEEESTSALSFVMKVKDWWIQVANLKQIGNFVFVFEQYY